MPSTDPRRGQVVNEQLRPFLVLHPIVIAAHPIQVGEEPVAACGTDDYKLPSMQADTTHHRLCHGTVSATVFVRDGDTDRVEADLSEDVAPIHTTAAVGFRDGAR